eukprot:TRINITY_DN1875_c2_g1_i2.p1 TRINITY_DN1875_c2_g1~~TRINITY_DN1875_c2_g1_i2.p1  ORF type:complete len:564 (+),score=92.95 TRINITY_DN1875_c2_g1_i2:1140-2831(+)
MILPQFCMKLLRIVPVYQSFVLSHYLINLVYPHWREKKEIELSSSREKLIDVFKGKTIVSAMVKKDDPKTQNSPLNAVHCKMFDTDTSKFRYMESITSLELLQQHADKNNDKKLLVYQSRGFNPPEFVPETSLLGLSPVAGSVFLFQYISKIPLLDRGRPSLVDTWMEFRTVTVQVLPAPGGFADAFKNQQEFAQPSLNKKYDGRKVPTATIKSLEVAKEVKEAIGLRDSVDVSVFFINNETEQPFSEISVLELEYFKSGIYYTFDLATAEHEATPDEVAKARKSYLADVVHVPATTNRDQSSVKSVQQSVKELSQEERRKIYETKFGSMGSAKRTLHNEELRSDLEDQKEAHRQQQIDRKRREMMADRAAKEQEKKDVYDRMRESQSHILGDTVLGRERLNKKVEDEKEEFRKAKQQRDRLAALKERDFRASERARVKQEYEQQRNDITKRLKSDATTPSEPSTASSTASAPAVAQDFTSASISFRLPDGSTKESEFPLTSSLGSLKLWLVHNTPAYHSVADKIRLMCPYPRRPYTSDELQMSLTDLRFARKTQITVHVARE